MRCVGYWEFACLREYECTARKCIARFCRQYCHVSLRSLPSSRAWLSVIGLALLRQLLLCRLLLCSHRLLVLLLILLHSHFMLLIARLHCRLVRGVMGHAQHLQLSIGAGYVAVLRGSDAGH